MARANREHLGILDTCVRSDADRAAALTADHIRGARDSLTEHMERRVRR